MELRRDPANTLADYIHENRRVVFISGAGLSYASGIPTFRGNSNSIWVNKAAYWGQKSSFLRFTRKIPNAGHEALAKLANMSANLRVVTQNIDSLHQQTKTPWDTTNQLIEIHGRLGLYHCSSEKDCQLATETWTTAKDIFPEHLRHAVEEEEDAEVELEEAPLCPTCKESTMMPLALMFDEDYTSHAFYRFDAAMSWFESAEALVFVGTSFSVNITNIALREAKSRSIPVFNYNVQKPAGICVPKARYTVYNVLGPAEENLTRLVQLVELRRPAMNKAAIPRYLTPPKLSHTASFSSSASSSSASSSSRPLFVLDPILPHPMTESQITIDLSPDYARSPHPDPAIESSIDRLWSSLVAKSPHLFNGLKFRLASWDYTKGDKSTSLGSAKRIKQEHTGGEDEEDLANLRLVLRVWLTDYKTFRGTNWHPEVDRLREEGRADYGQEEAYLSHKLGVSMAVHTTDNHLLLLRRSGKVAEGQGILDVPGGHPEPKNIGITSLDPSQLPPTLDPSTVAHELFQSAIDEVRDEVNIPEALLTDVRLLGVVRQGNSGGCPSAALVVRCQCTSQEAREWYNKGAKEAFESSSLFCLSIEDLRAGRLQQEELTPAAQGCIQLFEILCLGGSVSGSSRRGKKAKRAAGVRASTARKRSSLSPASSSSTPLP